MVRRTPLEARLLGSDGPRPDRAVKAVVGCPGYPGRDRVRVVREGFPAGKPLLQRPVAFRIAGNHVRRGSPTCPFSLARDRSLALEVEGLDLANANAVPHRLAVLQNEVAKPFVWIDDDRAGLLARLAGDLLPVETWLHGVR